MKMTSRRNPAGAPRWYWKVGGTAQHGKLEWRKFKSAVTGHGMQREHYVGQMPEEQPSMHRRDKRR